MERFGGIAASVGAVGGAAAVRERSEDACLRSFTGVSPTEIGRGVVGVVLEMD
jgi:hypothetical protein